MNKKVKMTFLNLNGFMFIFSFAFAFMQTFFPLHAEQISDPLDVLSNAETPKKCIRDDIKSKDLSLPDLIEVAICNNPTLNKSYMQAKSAAAALGQSKSDYLPNINAGADFGYTHTKNSGSENRQNNGSSNNSNIGASLSLNWLLYDFGQRETNVEITKKKLENANFTRNQSMQDTVFNVSKAYFTLLSARESLDASITNEETYLKSFEIASKRHELGLVSLSDKLQAETAYAQSQLSTTKAEQKLKESYGSLAEVLNLPPYSEIDIADVNYSFADGEFEGEIKSLIEEALTNRYDLKAKESLTEVAKLAITSSELADMPTISLGSSVSARNKFTNDKGQTYSGDIGLSINVPLFTGFNSTYTTLAKRYDYIIAKDESSAKQNEIRTDVWNCYQTYNTSVKNFEITEKLFASASENERVALGAYKAGKGNIIDLLEAQYNLALARMEKSSSLYNMLLAKNDLLRAIGKMEIKK